MQWVLRQNELEHYQRFIKRFPDHNYTDAIKKRIIDLEVSEIAGSDKTGLLPPSEPNITKRVSGNPEMTIKNDTKYLLTVRYSGPDSKKIIFSAGETKAFKLPAGSYKVTASVAGANVSNFYGEEKLNQKSGYESRFFITTSNSRF